MPLVNAKCTNCGANLQIDSTKDALVCPYCGSAFIVEKAINYYNTTNHISAHTVNIYGGNSADFVITAGKLIKYNGASTVVVIPNTVKIIGDMAFKDCAGLISVTIPNSVTKIGSTAFEGCTGLTGITIPNSVTEIEYEAFYGCTGLTRLTIPGSVKTVWNGAFKRCTGLKSVIISNGVTRIGPEAFEYCAGLTSVSIPNSVTMIEGYAFQGCDALASVTIPAHLVNIGPYVFPSTTTVRNALETGSYAQPGGASYQRPNPTPQKTNTTTTSSSSNSGCCYIATCVYGSYDCPNVWTLRRFRDDTLDRTALGRAFIKCYYAISPKLVKRFGDTKWFKKFWKAFLDRLVAALNKNGVANTKYVDKY